MITPPRFVTRVAKLLPFHPPTHPPTTLSLSAPTPLLRMPPSPKLQVSLFRASPGKITQKSVISISLPSRLVLLLPLYRLACAKPTVTTTKENETKGVAQEAVIRTLTHPTPCLPSRDAFLDSKVTTTTTALGVRGHRQSLISKSRSSRSWWLINCRHRSNAELDDVDHSSRRRVLRERSDLSIWPPSPKRPYAEDL